MTCQGGVVVIRNYLELMAPNEKYQDHILLGKKTFLKEFKEIVEEGIKVYIS